MRRLAAKSVGWGMLMTRLPIAISGLGYTRNVGQAAWFVADHTHVVNFFTDWATKYYIFGVEWVGGLQYLTSVAVVAASSASSFIGFHYTYLLKGRRAGVEPANQGQGCLMPVIMPSFGSRLRFPHAAVCINLSPGYAPGLDASRSI